MSETNTASYMYGPDGQFGVGASPDVGTLRKSTASSPQKRDKQTNDLTA